MGLREKTEQSQEFLSIDCPWCNEHDFDLMGLKSHLLNGDCEPFNHLPILTRMFCKGGTIASAAPGGG